MDGAGRRRPGDDAGVAAADAEAATTTTAVADAEAATTTTAAAAEVTSGPMPEHFGADGRYDDLVGELYRIATNP